jgi:hypothetical protein
VHRQLMTKAEKITGYTSEPETPKIETDPATGAIKIKYNDDPKTKYTWKDFTFDQGKITGWTGKTGPVKPVLWSRMTSDPVDERQAEVCVPVKQQGAVRHRGAVLQQRHQLGATPNTPPRAATGRWRLTMALVILPLVRIRSRTLSRGRHVRWHRANPLIRRGRHQSGQLGAGDQIALGSGLPQG